MCVCVCVCLFAFAACLFAHPACSAVCLSALLFGWPAVRVCLSVRPCVCLCDCLLNVSVRVFDRVSFYPATCASAWVSVSPPLSFFIFVSICVPVSVSDYCLSLPISTCIPTSAYLAVSLSVCVLVSVPIVLRLASWLGAVLCADCGGRMGGGDVLTWLSRACARCECFINPYNK